MPANPVLVTTVYQDDSNGRYCNVIYDDNIDRYHIDYYDNRGLKLVEEGFRDITRQQAEDRAEEWALNERKVRGVDYH